MSHLFRSSIIIAIFFGMEKVLGFIRNILIARVFNLSPELDIFNAANNIPDLLFALISGGALAFAFIPVLSDTLEKQGRPEAWKLFSQIINLVFIIAAVMSVIIAIFAEPLVRSQLGIAPGFDTAQQDVVITLMRLNLFATLLFALAGVVISGLQANQHFILPAMAPVMYDVGALLGVLVLAPSESISFGPITLPALGLGVYGLVYGTIFGAALFFLIQIPGLIHYQFRWTPKINLRDPGVRQVLVLMGPRLISVLSIHLVFITQDNLASRLVAGSVTALVYGWLFMQVPESLVGTTIGTVLLPTLSEQAARKDTVALERSINYALRVLLALTLPLAVILILGIHPLISILGFDAAGTELVVWTVRAYMLGLVGHSLLEVAVRSFYAQKNAKTPMLTSLLMLVTFIAVSIPLSLWLGAPGIGLANSLVFTGQALLLLWLLHRSLPNILALRRPLLRSLLAAGVGGGMVLIGFALLPITTMALIPSIVAMLAVLGVSSIAALPIIWPEAKLLLNI